MANNIEKIKLIEVLPNKYRINYDKDGNYFILEFLEENNAQVKISINAESFKHVFSTLIDNIIEYNDINDKNFLDDVENILRKE